VICPICGTRNEPGTRLCSTCGFILGSAPADPLGDRLIEKQGYALLRPASRLEKLENTKRGIALVLALVIIVIVVAIIAAVNLFSDDAVLSATLFYDYFPGTGSSPGTVRIWGNVLNWGESAGSGHLTITISDNAGHVLKDRIDVGPVPPNGAVAVGKTYVWDYGYAAGVLDPVTVTYDL